MLSDKEASDDLEKAMAQAVERVRKLCETIRDAPATQDEEWFRNLLFGLLRCALMDHYSAKLGAQKSVYLAAWGRRNLLELRVITEYVLASEQNAIDFRNELALDAKEFYEAMSQSHRATHKEMIALLSEMAKDEGIAAREVLDRVIEREQRRGPQTEATDLEASGYKQLMVDFGLGLGDRPKRAGQIARLIDRQETFNPMFKICSKIMHRTSLSVASSITRGSLDTANPLLSNSADNDLLLIFGLIDLHFKRHGVRPPRKSVS